jgi:hypothetical protein
MADFDPENTAAELSPVDAEQQAFLPWTPSDSCTAQRSDAVNLEAAQTTGG